MLTYPDKVFIYEINTWVWLTTLAERYGKTIKLNTVPDEVLDELERASVDYVWLMGVWKRSPFAQTNALKYKHEYVPVLPDLSDDDVIGSAYSIGDYRVDERIGGRGGLAALRRRLSKRGIKLILDYVPNHIAIDHPWVRRNPDYIIQGTPRNVEERPSDFFFRPGRRGKEPVVLAHGRDPLFPGWSDTAQLNIFNPGLRAAVIRTLLDIGRQCDGVRCDMAMLVMNDIFGGTWNGWLSDGRPEIDFWLEVIPQVRNKYPDFLFIAEVYWDKEYDVLQQGFDFAYDKIFYDRVMGKDVQKLRQHLVADIDYQKRMLRFIENHDEPRAFDRLGYDRSFPAATLISTLPGAVLLHDGQFTGRIVKLPVQIKRQPQERVYPELEDYYLKLLRETRDPIYQNGEWYLFELQAAGAGDISHLNMLAYGWREKDRNYRLVVVNLTEHRSVARLPMGYWGELAGKQWRLRDVIDNTTYQRDGNEMTSIGMFIELDPFESHIFQFGV